MIVWPTQNMGFVDWADSLRLTRPDLTSNYITISEDQWQDWAFNLLQNNDLIRLNAPFPYGFADWRDWAERFISALGAAA